MKALEDDADYKLKTLKENDNELKDIDAIKTKLKVLYAHRLMPSKFYNLSTNFWRNISLTFQVNQNNF